MAKHILLHLIPCCSLRQSWRDQKNTKEAKSLLNERFRFFLNFWKSAKSLKIKVLKLSSECPKPGSNRHVFKGHWILSPTRLPIPPFGHIQCRRFLISVQGRRGGLRWHRFAKVLIFLGYSKEKSHCAAKYSQSVIIRELGGGRENIFRKNWLYLQGLRSCLNLFIRSFEGINSGSFNGFSRKIAVLSDEKAGRKWRI